MCLVPRVCLQQGPCDHVIQYIYVTSAPWEHHLDQWQELVPYLVLLHASDVIYAIPEALVERASSIYTRRPFKEMRLVAMKIIGDQNLI
jgi:hypothetical protein